MFNSLEEALQKAKTVTPAQNGEPVEEQGVKFCIESATIESNEASLSGRDLRLTAKGAEGTVAVLFAQKPKVPLYGHDKKHLSEQHKKFSPKGTAVKKVAFYNVGGKLVIVNEIVMPIMGLKLHQSQLLFDAGDKQVSVTVCSPNKAFPTDDIADEILHSLYIEE